jgi:hypothetical protein
MTYKTIIETELRTAGLQPMALRTLRLAPRVSILLSNYNYAAYIEQSIQSVLDQTYQNFELIICDDGSTDDSLEIIERYKHRDNRIRVISKQNGGQASGFNAAYLASTGEILCLLDSDDLYSPLKLERVVAALQKHQDAGFLVHRVITVDKDRHRQGVWPLSSGLPAGWLGPQLLKASGIVAFMPPTSGLILRREVARRIFPLPTEAPLGACPDQVVMRLAPCISRIAAINEPLAEYRLHGDNSYATARVTTSSVERELMVNERLWRAQKEFLAGIDPEVSTQLAPLKKNTYVLLLEYMHARLAGKQNVRQRHADYLAAVATEPESAHRWFWELSISLPKPLFSFAINLLMRQNKIKQIVARLKGFA